AVSFSAIRAAIERTAAQSFRRAADWHCRTRPSMRFPDGLSPSKWPHLLAVGVEAFWFLLGPAATWSAGEASTIPRADVKGELSSAVSGSFGSAFLGGFAVVLSDCEDVLLAPAAAALAGPFFAPGFISTLGGGLSGLVSGSATIRAPVVSSGCAS